MPFFLFLSFSSLSMVDVVPVAVRVPDQHGGSILQFLRQNLQSEKGGRQSIVIATSGHPAILLFICHRTQVKC